MSLILKNTLREEAKEMDQFIKLFLGKNGEISSNLGAHVKEVGVVVPAYNLQMTGTETDITETHWQSKLDKSVSICQWETPYQKTRKITTKEWSSRLL